MDFLKISDMCLENKNWKESIFITIDVDWASDEVLKDTIDILSDSNIKATILMTHKTDLIQDIEKNPLFELGIHPNFNFLLNSDFRYGKNYCEVIDYYLKIVPNSKVVRSHSVTQNTSILEYFKKNGLVYDLNTEVPFSSNIMLKPYVDWTGLIKVPYFWQENISFAYNWNLDSSLFTNNNFLKVFNFHPIHIFLNTESIERYNTARPYLQTFHRLKAYKNNHDIGVRTFLNNLIGRQI